MTRPRLLLAVVLSAVVVLCVALWVGEGPLWRIVMLREIHYVRRRTARRRDRPGRVRRQYQQHGVGQR